MSLLSLEYEHVECRMKCSKIILKQPLSSNPAPSSRCSLTNRSACGSTGREAILFCFGTVICALASLLWSLLQLWCHCSCDTLVSGVVPSTLVLSYVQHATNVGHCFNFGLGVAFFSMMLLCYHLLSMLVLLFKEQSCCFGPGFIAAVVVLLFVQCTCKWCYSFYFGVVVHATCKHCWMLF